MIVDFSKYDFVDFGSGAGDFMEIAKGFGGKRGLGVENDPVRVRDINERKRDCVFGDVRRLEWMPDKCVRFVTISHLLEHMRTLHDARLVLRSALRLARDFVYVGGPNFDSNARLAGMGLKFYWADWPDSHPLHLTTAQLAWALTLEGAPHFMVWGSALIRSSKHPDIHPLESPPHSGHYDRKMHQAKEIVEFEPVVSSQFVCVATLRKLDYVDGLVGRYSGLTVLHRR